MTNSPNHKVQIRLIVKDISESKEVHLIYKDKEIGYFPQIGSSISTGHISAKVVHVAHVLDTGYTMIVCNFDGPVSNLNRCCVEAEAEGWVRSRVGGPIEQQLLSNKFFESNKEGPIDIDFTVTGLGYEPE